MEVWTLHQAFSLEAGEYLITVLDITAQAPYFIFMDTAGGLVTTQ